MAFHDARKLTSSSIEADVCIVGAGAAGITLARELAPRGCKVALIESGDLGFRHGPQLLYLGENVGLPGYSTGRSRLRMFGGSTTRWAGQCRPLEALDFEAREGVAHSGWPFGRETLEPYYARAQRICNLGPYDYTPARWQEPGHESLPLHGSDLETRIFQFAFPRDFGKVYGEELKRAAGLDVYLNADVVDIELRAGSGQVAALQIATANGKRVRIGATAYVLACGGIENARLLLASNRVARAGVGNQNDLVGRFFMDHPYFMLGWFQPAAQRFDAGIHVIEDYERMGVVQKVNAALAFDERTLRSRSLNGAAVYFVRRPAYKAQPEYFSPAGRSFVHLLDVLRHHELPDGHTLRHVANVVGGIGDIGRSLSRQITHAMRPQNVLAVRAIVEGTPHRESRVMLGTRKDRYGMPRVRVDWRLHESDRRGLEKLLEALKSQFARSQLGTLFLNPSRDASGWPTSMTGGKHHMGTTRMHPDPGQGVVDPDCRVHGCDNLYVAGSSVFPTGGAANPTLTIVALAVRLADHIAQNLRTEVS